MRGIFFILMFGLMTTGCSKPEDKFIGTWISPGSKVRLLDDGSAIITDEKGQSVAASWKIAEQEAFVQVTGMLGMTTVMPIRIEDGKLRMEFNGEHEYLYNENDGYQAYYVTSPRASSTQAYFKVGIVERNAMTGRQVQTVSSTISLPRVSKDQPIQAYVETYNCSKNSKGEWEGEGSDLVKNPLTITYNKDAFNFPGTVLSVPSAKIGSKLCLVFGTNELYEVNGTPTNFMAWAKPA